MSKENPFMRSTNHCCNGCQNGPQSYRQCHSTYYYTPSRWNSPRICTSCNHADWITFNDDIVSARKGSEIDTILSLFKYICFT